MRVLDLFCGRWGWSRAFAARGWECFGIDLAEPPDTPDRCEFWQYDILSVSVRRKWFRLTDATSTETVACSDFDFIVASPPCEEFSVHGMKHFHPNPKYPEMGIKLFNHTRSLCEASGVPYVMENVRAAQQFVGQAVHHCGPFYLWGNAVPPIVGQGILKGATQMRRDGSYRRRGGVDERMYKAKDIRAKELATIPPELANCVAAYAERLLEQRAEQRPLHREAAK